MGGEARQLVPGGAGVGLQEAGLQVARGGREGPPGAVGVLQGDLGAEAGGALDPGACPGPWPWRPCAPRARCAQREGAGEVDQAPAVEDAGPEAALEVGGAPGGGGALPAEAHPGGDGVQGGAGDVQGAPVAHLLGQEGEHRLRQGGDAGQGAVVGEEVEEGADGRQAPHVAAQGGEEDGLVLAAVGVEVDEGLRRTAPWPPRRRRRGAPSAPGGRLPPPGRPGRWCAPGRRAPLRGPTTSAARR